MPLFIIREAQTAYVIVEAPERERAYEAGRKAKPEETRFQRGELSVTPIDQAPAGMPVVPWSRVEPAAEEKPECPTP